LKLTTITKLFFSKPDVALRTYIVAPRDYAESLVEELVRRGLFEPLPPEEAGKVLEAVKRRSELAERALALFKELNSLVEKSVEVEITELPWDTDAALEKLVAEFEEVRGVVKRLLEEAERAREELEKLKALRLVVQRLSESGAADKSLLDYEGALVVSKTLYGGVREVESITAKALKTLLHATLSEDRAVAVVVLDRRTYRSLEAAAKKLELPVSTLLGEAPVLELSHVDRLVELAEKRLVEIKSRVQSLLENRLHDLALLRALAEVAQYELGVLGKALSSKYTAVVVGWTLKSRRGELEKVLRAVRGYAVFEEVESAPVELSNLKPFKPFEVITDVMGYPAPREWDPTPLITYFYLIFFALMFPDVGYAIGLIIGARLVLPFFVENRETLKKLVNMATYAGIAGCVAGLLANSFLGSLLGSYIGRVVPRLLPSLPPGLADPVALGSAVMEYIKLALLVGYYSVIVAHVIGLVKSAITRRAGSALLEALVIAIAITGPAAIEATIGIKTDVWGLLRLVNPGTLLYSTIALVVVYAVFKSVLERPLGAVLWLFDIIGVMGDTFSFVRIAGLAIGSAVLAELINNLILSLTPAISSVSIAVGVLVGAAISVLLHTVNLGLSSLGPFIHSLRLVMYEVSTKFYEGSGRRISPVLIPLLRVRVGSSRL
jgi:V/A-type H+-transporting ATPase subunit I